MNEASPDVTPTPQIPNKLYFKIGEVSSLLAVEPYVLRFWETEFPKLAPRKTDKGQRMYRRKDVELLLQIKHLLYDKKYTIEGARQFLQHEGKAGSKPRVVEKQQALFANDTVGEIRKELKSILEMLSR